MIQQNFIARNAGWLITIILCLVPVFFWLELNSIGDEIQGNFTSKTLALGQIAGLVGMVMYSLNLIYATRLRFIENLFGGLNKVYKAHHILGGLALIFLCFHPLFLALSHASFSLREGALLLIPNGLGPISSLFDKTDSLHFSVTEQWAVFMGIIAFWGMVVLLIITFYIKLPYAVWLFIHRFLGVAFVFALAHVAFITSDTSASRALKAYLISLAVLGLLAFVYRSLLSGVFVRRYMYRVSSVKKLGDNVTQISMSPYAKKLEFKAGQFVFLRFRSSDKSLSKEWHPFSISSSPNDEELKISAKSLGDFTSILSTIPKGTWVEIEGAYGKFSHTNYKNLNQIWIAGGIGITPFLSMAQKLPNDDYRVDLYYCVRSKSELIETEKLEKIMKIKSSNLKIYPFFSNNKEDYLTAETVEKKSDKLIDKDIFICGPPSMMSGLKEQFIRSGVSKKNIHTEEFSID